MKYRYYEKISTGMHYANGPFSALMRTKSEEVELGDYGSHWASVERVLWEWAEEWFESEDGEEYGFTITAGNDGKHSTNSLHYKNEAIDLRIRDMFLKSIKASYTPMVTAMWWRTMVAAGVDLTRRFRMIGLDKMVVVLEKHHFHIQNGTENIRSYAEGQNYYTSRNCPITDKWKGIK